MVMSKDESPRVLRELLINSVEDITGNYDEVALSLSGGIDSSTILFSLLELGKKVNCYTFYLEDVISNDLKASRKLCEKYNLNLVEIEVSKSNIKNDFITLAKFGCNKKVLFETKIHLLYLMREVKEDCLLNGEEADVLNGNLENIKNKSVNNPLEFNRLRLEEWYYFNNVDFNINKRIAYMNNVELYSPYYNKDIWDFYLRFDWKYLNKPYVKWLSLKAFEDYFGESYRRPSSYHQDSGMASFCKTLIGDKDINFNNRKRMREVYIDFYNEYG